MKTRYLLYPLLFLLSVAMSASSCSLFVPQERDIKEGSAFYAVDLLEIEKIKGEEMLFSDLIESLEIIKLDDREEAFKGNILQKISAVNYAIVPDYSNEVLALRNVDGYSFSLCQVVGRTRPDTLYHYDIANNVLKPCFTLDNVMQEDKYIVTLLYETPEYYWSRVTIGPAKVPSDGSPVRMTVFNVRVSKKDGSVKRIDRFTNDFLGLSYPFLTMCNGYVCISYEPLGLMDALDKVLAQTDLKLEIRKRVTNLRNSLHENDNDILMIGKLKSNY